MQTITFKKLSIRFGLLFALAANLSAESNLISTNAVPVLREAVIIIVRHAEKPDAGVELSPTGQERARAYADYFKNLTLDSTPFKPDYLFATGDSGNSHRPRLTLEPLSRALGLKIDARFKNKDFEKLVAEMRSRDHGRHILIAWHHGEIPELARALGADPARLLPDGKWPGETFNWMLILRFDHEGHLMPGHTERISEHLLPGDK